MNLLKTIAVVGFAVALLLAVAGFFISTGWPLIRSAFSPDDVAKCSADKFRIESHSARVDGGRMIISAVVRNNNAQACGVRVGVAVKDEAGKVVANEPLWVAGVYNIPPGATQSFPVYLPSELSRQAQTGGYDIKPIDARVWKQQ